MQNSLVSIILPTYNGGTSINRSIESVKAQSFKDWELLIIDDGSTDDTKDIISNYLDDDRINYIKNDKNLGIQKTLNKGIRESKGLYIARIDDDDEWKVVTKLEKQLDFLINNIDYVLVGTGVELVNEQYKVLSKYLLPETDENIRARILGRNCFAHSSVLFRKDCVSTGYSEDISVRHVEDQELWLQLGEKGKLFNLQEYMTQIQVSTESITAKNRVVQAKRMLILCWGYRKSYPFVVKNSLFALLRYVFFLGITFIPIPKKILYKLQSLTKNS